MNDNPLEKDPVREARIRALAHRLWEEDGRAEGREADFHEQARILIGMKAHPEAGLQPNPLAEGHDTATPPVEEAELQENLGEFPSRLTDQGDRPQTPRQRRRE